MQRFKTSTPNTATIDYLVSIQSPPQTYCLKPTQTHTNPDCFFFADKCKASNGNCHQTGSPIMLHSFIFTIPVALDLNHGRYCV